MAEGSTTDDEVQRKAAAYARQPTVWAAAPQPERGPGAVRRTLDLIRIATGVLVLAIVPPVVLTLVFGNPAGLIPSGEQFTEFRAANLAWHIPDLVVHTVAAVLWLCWLATAVLLVGSLLSLAGGWRLPRWRLPAPVHRMLFGLAGTAVVAVVTTPHGGGSAPAPAVASAGTTDLQQGTVTVLVGEERFSYRVKRGDSLSKIARKWLGDADRWPEICRLNRHQHQAGGARLTDCDLIRPGWQLRLPDDARQPGAGTEPERRVPAPRPPVAAPADPPVTAPSPPPSSPPPSTSATPSATASPQPSTSDDGIHLPSGTVVTWTLAAAISTVVALLWRQRSRRRIATGSSIELPAPRLPEPVDTIHRHARHRPGTPTTTVLPARPIGFDGPGTPGAVRGLILAALTTGAPDDPDHRAEVVIDRATCTDLFGPGLTGWPRLHITADFTDTINTVDARILHRARILEEHNLDTLAAVRDTAPAEEALPPILLIATATDASAEHARITLRLGTELDITAALIGPWRDGTTHQITADGHTTAQDGHSPLLPEQVDVLDRGDALALLATIREAHTGQTATTEPSQPEWPDPSQLEPVTQPVEQNTGEPTAEPGTVAPVRIRVLGAPRIDGITRPGNNLRAKAAELAVFLACHPDGADTDTIGEHLLGDVRLRQAKQQVHTNASNLRHVLARAGGLNPGGYLLKRGTTSRYRFDTATVTVDLWQLRDLLQRARLTPAPDRTDLLQQACDLYTAPLADGHDYEWIDPHREAVRRWASEAHLLLAEDLLAATPQKAVDILAKAITLDPYREDLYQAAMRAHHALGDSDGIRTVLRALTKALTDLDAEPDPKTIDLANQLRAGLMRPGRASGQNAPLPNSGH
ncbi:BTAD domain-containing putative transcriptional regulator [Actinoplanes couchii]|uniref:BTAD domain-containing putative transcriptional regulator n=1 Tax=Actinoplanes couchii TaxID=403638 RepID=UPI001944F9C2|nr:BTAD domain-containing putative transcriptional regulator [Actinoplanes couchii]MDR6318593.1 DNA-binding SARP family transcriptional activator/nucleoid-associated protein YgaU [Actinoplanes couchii]